MVPGLLGLLSVTFAVLEVGTTDRLDSWTKPEEGVEWWWGGESTIIRRVGTLLYGRVGGALS